jgi:hypothetical protein
MKFEINITKFRFFVILSALVLVVASAFVVAYTTDGSGNPAVMGHSLDEVGLGDLQYGTADVPSDSEIGIGGKAVLLGHKDAVLVDDYAIKMIYDATVDISRLALSGEEAMEFRVNNEQYILADGRTDKEWIHVYKDLKLESGANIVLSEGGEIEFSDGSKMSSADKLLIGGYYFNSGGGGNGYSDCWGESKCTGFDLGCNNDNFLLIQGVASNGQYFCFNK